MSSNTKLPLTGDEKLKLRRAKIKISELYHFEVDKIAHILNTPVEKARLLKGLAEFQSIPSIGYKLAENLVFDLNIFSLSEIKDKNGAELFNQLEKKLGVLTDSCVEDQFRCVVHYANNPKSNKQWFDFTEERKAYREIVGFPIDRPI
ncbi:Pathogenicity locus [Bacillus sp. BRMEA1]|uniref:helix-hairpin-helix domain-containing protein n=1 Tax=Neobacillus endophyticus TaxID=2738405 RepID=UPI001566D804|nr:helix-hairpin-helix domain-containing protein [Neobacillus endophyticus]NRD79921.1 Pathogenicity locus [Neobacillus endophyticus]